MERYKVEFRDGELWYEPDKYGNYMLCRIEGGETILYSEKDYDDYAERIGATPEEIRWWCTYHYEYPRFLDRMMYDDMRREIITIAENYGITEAQLDFEPCCSPDEVPEDIHDYA